MSGGGALWFDPVSSPERVGVSGCACMLRDYFVAVKFAVIPVTPGCEMEHSSPTIFNNIGRSRWNKKAAKALLIPWLPGEQCKSLTQLQNHTHYSRASHAAFAATSLGCPAFSAAICKTPSFSTAVAFSGITAAGSDTVRKIWRIDDSMGLVFSPALATPCSWKPRIVSF